MRATLRMAMAETVAVATAHGVTLPQDIVEQKISFMLRIQNPESTPSTLRDFENNRPSELDALCKVVVDMGREKGVPTPVHSLVYSLLAPSEARSRGMLSFIRGPEDHFGANTRTQAAAHGSAEAKSPL